MGMSIDYETKRLTFEKVFGERGRPLLNGAGENFAADHDIEILGANASSDDLTQATDGGLLLTTDGADADGIFLVPHLDAPHGVWDDVTFGTDDEVEWECALKAGDITNLIVWAGLKLSDADAAATDADQAYFRMEDDVSSQAIVAHITANSSLHSHVSNNGWVASEIYRFAVKFDKDEICHMFLNGREVFSRSFRGNTADLKPYIGVEADGAANAASLVVYHQKISRILK